MTRKRKMHNLGHVFLALGGLVFILVTAMLFVVKPPEQFYGFALRFTGLWGFIFMALAAIMIPYLRGIKKNFGISFIRMHYILSYFGLAFTFIHSILPAIQRADITAILPDFSSWSGFWRLGAGEVAFLLMIIAAIGIFLKPKIRPWRVIHGLMYPMLLLSLVHATVVGSTMESMLVLTIFYVLFALVILAFILKRIRQQKLKKMRRSSKKD